VEAFALLWIGEGGRQRAVGERRQLQVLLAEQGGGALLHHHHLPEEQQQTGVMRGRRAFTLKGL